MAHIEPHMYPWDCLAGLAIVEAAGGRINDFLTGDALFKGNRVAAAAPQVFEQLQAYLD